MIESMVERSHGDFFIDGLFSSLFMGVNDEETHGEESKKK